MRIIGIDPGLNITGFGIIEISDNGLQCLKYGGIRTSSSASFTDKLLNIHQQVQCVIEEFRPNYCAVENIFYHRNKKTAIIMGHSRAVAMLAAAQHSIPIYEYSPREVKMSIVGYGAASKKQVQSMVQNILHLNEKPCPEDAADALAVAICLYHRLKLLSVSR
ncbi:MAG TPA: crossover junction endodeoxyribonuclease RuvC [Bacteroidetes bacterium]|nr:crossover junction endodeoxyribonuclease RuvC [Bacteroidota bacterium]